MTYKVEALLRKTAAYNALDSLEAEYAHERVENDHVILVAIVRFERDGLISTLRTCIDVTGRDQVNDLQAVHEHIERLLSPGESYS